MEIIEMESEMVLFVIVKDIKAFYSCNIHLTGIALELWTHIGNILILDLIRVSEHSLPFLKSQSIILIINLSIFI